jgi:TPR repeat protein
MHGMQLRLLVSAKSGNPQAMYHVAKVWKEMKCKDHPDHKLCKAQEELWMNRLQELDQKGNDAYIQWLLSESKENKRNCLIERFLHDRSSMTTSYENELILDIVLHRLSRKQTRKWLKDNEAVDFNPYVRRKLNLLSQCMQDPDYKKLKILAEQDEEACMVLGCTYEHVRGDDQKALKWFLKAGEMGVSDGYRHAAELIEDEKKKVDLYWKMVFVGDDFNGYLHLGIHNMSKDRDLAIGYLKASSNILALSHLIHLGESDEEWYWTSKHNRIMQLIKHGE